MGGETIACTADFSYWTEIAIYGGGKNDSEWRTDVAARNIGAAGADVELILHTGTGDSSIHGMIAAGAQGVFEDVVGMMGEEAKGSLQLCSTQPLEVVQRIYNTTDEGTFGQFLDGYPDGSGLLEGESARLIGLRQKPGKFRTNISFTNTGIKTARVRITLYDSAGTELHSYQLTVRSGMVVQDLEPFRTRAGAPNLGWGFATVEVVTGSGILTSASVADSGTNDSVTIPMKR
jgi:hypothetical protein